MRVRIVLVVALLLVAGALALDMSGRTERTAGSNHVTAAEYFGAAAVPTGGVLCQPILGLPSDAADVQIVLGTYGRPVPSIEMRFLTAAGAVVAAGSLQAGASEGPVTIPLKRVPGATGAARACMHIGPSARVLVGGEPGSGGEPLSVNGAPHVGRISLLYLRHGRESWWQLLGVLATRFGLGKASIFGTWTLPALALLLVAVWIATARLLVRELT